MSNQYCAKSTVQDYDEFVKSTQPWDLMKELAAQRALIVEFRRSLDAQSLELSEKFLSDVEADIATVVSLEKARGGEDFEATLDRLQVSMLSAVKQSYSFNFPSTSNSRISANDAMVMSKLFRTLTECAEKYKKIFDGVKIGLSVDHQLEQVLVNFVVNCILPNIAVQDRMAVSQAVMEFLPQLNGETAMSEDVLEGEVQYG